MFIICGILHGGTSLPMVMLNQHPKLHILMENKNIFSQPKEYQKMEAKYTQKGIILGDKLLSHMMFWKDEKREYKWLDYYRNNKCLFIYRDGRDVVLSHRERTMIPWEESVDLWNKYVNRAREYIAEFPLIAEWMKFEDFLLDTEKVLDAVCDWLGIPYTDKMLDFKMPVPMFAKKYGHKIDKSRCQVYKNWKDQKFIKMLTEKMKDNLELLGYEICS